MAVMGTQGAMYSSQILRRHYYNVTSHKDTKTPSKYLLLIEDNKKQHTNRVGDMVTGEGWLKTKYVKGKRG